MNASNDKQRIAQLELALQECVALLRSLPPNAVVWGQARKAQEILDAVPANQPLFGSYFFNPPGNDSIADAMELQAIVGPTAKYVNLSIRGNVQLNLKSLVFSLENSGSPGLFVPIAQNPELAVTYQGELAVWDQRRSTDLNNSIQMMRTKML